MFSVDGGIVIVKGPVGKEAQANAKTEPQESLELQHEMEGATDMQRGE